MMTEESHRSTLSLIVAIAAGIVLGGLALSMAVWMIGALFHVVFFLVRIGIVVGFIALGVWLFTRLFSRHGSMGH